MNWRPLAPAAVILAVFSLSGAVSRAQQSQQSGQTNPPVKTKSSDSSMDDMPGMPGMHGDAQQQAEAGADEQMMRGHHHMGAHMHMTALRPASPEDWARADEIAGTLRDAIAQYKDYKVALSDGYRIFMPNLPQEIYHFTNYQNGFLESFTFDPSRPTSLLYKKSSSGWELVGAMYTMPRSATEEQLNERVPLSVAQWHLHTNLCLPQRGQMQNLDMKEFGLTGSIATKGGCDAAGGRFYPVIFGWMVHVYPFESSRQKIWEQ